MFLILRLKAAYQNVSQARFTEACPEIKYRLLGVAASVAVASSHSYVSPTVMMGG